MCISTKVKSYRQSADKIARGAARQVHIDRLLATLAGICRHLRQVQSRREVRAAYREVEQWLLECTRKPARPRFAGRREP